MHFQFASSLIMIYVHKEFPQFSRQIEGVKWIYLFLSFSNLTRFPQFSRVIASVNQFVIRWFDEIFSIFSWNWKCELFCHTVIWRDFPNFLVKLKVWNESMFVFVIRWFDEIFLMCHCLLIVHKEWYNRQWHCQWQWNIILDRIQKRKKTSWRIRINDVVLRF